MVGFPHLASWFLPGGRTGGSMAWRILAVKNQVHEKPVGSGMGGKVPKNFGRAENKPAQSALPGTH
jgi:hypothetical protein